MSNQSRWLACMALALLMCLGIAAMARADGWREAYLSQLKSKNTKRAVALIGLSGSEAPELVEVSMDASGTATVRVYGYSSGKATKYACAGNGFSLDNFSFKGLKTVKMQLREGSDGEICLQIMMTSATGTARLGLTCPSRGKLTPVLAAVSSGGKYTLNGQNASAAKFESAQSGFNSAYTKRGSGLPAATLAKGAGGSAINKKLSTLAGKYSTFSTLKGIKLSKSALSLVAGKSATLALSRSPASAIFEDAKWTSSDSSVAKVDENGRVTGVSGGKATIRAKAGGLEKSCQVTVTGSSASPTGLALDVSAATLIKGESLTLTATPSPLGVTCEVRWSSSNTKVASVSQSGRVLALSKGSAVITAKTSNGKTAKCKVVVNNTGAVIVDISQHNDQSKMDWEKIAANVDLLILRCGVTRTEKKPLGIGKDDSFALYATKCKQYDIPFGVYYYGKCSSVEQAREEARFTWEIASPYKPLFYVYDAEESCLNKAKIEAYMTTLQSLGAKKTGYYIAHHRYASYNLDTSLVDFIWLPHYGSNNGKVNSAPSYPCDIHQYTDKGSVPGIAGKVDLNRLMGGKTLAWFTSR